MGTQAITNQVALVTGANRGIGKTIIDALENGQFHAFPDAMARQISEPYQPFAENVVEAELSE